MELNGVTFTKSGALQISKMGMLALIFGTAVWIGRIALADRDVVLASIRELKETTANNQTHIEEVAATAHAETQAAAATEKAHEALDEAKEKTTALAVRDLKETQIQQHNETLDALKVLSDQQRALMQAINRRNN